MSARLAFTRTAAAAALRPRSQATTTTTLLPLSRRALTTTASLQHKETSSHNPDHHDEIDRHKSDSLQKQQSGAGHWKPELASDSEEAVKADRADHPGETPADAMKRLQERTKKAAEENTKAGTSMRDGL